VRVIGEPDVAVFEMQRRLGQADPRTEKSRKVQYRRPPRRCAGRLIPLQRLRDIAPGFDDVADVELVLGDVDVHRQDAFVLAAVLEPLQRRRVRLSRAIEVAHPEQTQTREPCDPAIEVSEACACGERHFLQRDERLAVVQLPILGNGTIDRLPMSVGAIRGPEPRRRR
jgi:hypothetical protein